VPIGYATSSGTACAATVEEAVQAGLLELLERDAFMITWYARLSLPRLDWWSQGRLLDLERRYFAPARACYEVVDLTAFWDVPTLAAVVRARNGAIGVGAAAAPTVERAWLKALSEAFAVRAWASALRAAEPHRDFGADLSGIETFADHIRFYADEANAARAAFLTASRSTRPVVDVRPLDGGTPLARIEALCRRLANRGSGAFAVDVTAPDVRAAGLCVAKVVVPELCPLDVPYAARYLGGRRIYDEPCRLGLRSRPLDSADVNPDPHPFP
jgi:ribosomal protein S12 methylthiotransferase accessory factor